ncbi:hypothetical protein BC832DRAFT_42575 [Gaertneriomyces semiglobifer]|nr:hypothetical protein BC832DRAFT_42575 [Gaertneriomyces semiglobifer]
MPSITMTTSTPPTKLLSQHNAEHYAATIIQRAYRAYRERTHGHLLIHLQNISKAYQRVLIETSADGASDVKGKEGRPPGASRAEVAFLSLLNSDSTFRVGAYLASTSSFPSTASSLLSYHNYDSDSHQTAQVDPRFSILPQKDSSTYALYVPRIHSWLHTLLPALVPPYNPNTPYLLPYLLRTGDILCELAVVLFPRTQCALLHKGPEFTVHKAVFFLELCKAVGVKQKYLFTVKDLLYPDPNAESEASMNATDPTTEDQSPSLLLLRTLVALERQSRKSGFGGPFLSLKHKHGRRSTLTTFVPTSHSSMSFTIHHPTNRTNSFYGQIMDVEDVVGGDIDAARKLSARYSRESLYSIYASMPTESGASGGHRNSTMMGGSGGGGRRRSSSRMSGQLRPVSGFGPVSASVSDKLRSLRTEAVKEQDQRLEQEKADFADDEHDQEHEIDHEPSVSVKSEYEDESEHSGSEHADHGHGAVLQRSRLEPQPSDTSLQTTYQRHMSVMSVDVPFNMKQHIHAEDSSSYEDEGEPIIDLKAIAQAEFGFGEKTLANGTSEDTLKDKYMKHESVMSHAPSQDSESENEHGTLQPRRDRMQESSPPLSASSFDSGNENGTVTRRWNREDERAGTACEETPGNTWEHSSSESDRARSRSLARSVSTSTSRSHSMSRSDADTEIVTLQRMNTYSTIPDDGTNTDFSSPVSPPPGSATLQSASHAQQQASLDFLELPELPAPVPATNMGILTDRFDILDDNAFGYDGFEYDDDMLDVPRLSIPPPPSRSPPFKKSVGEKGSKAKKPRGKPLPPVTGTPSEASEPTSPTSKDTPTLPVQSARTQSPPKQPLKLVVPTQPPTAPLPSLLLSPPPQQQSAQPLQLPLFDFAKLNSKLDSSLSSSTPTSSLHFGLGGFGFGVRDASEPPRSPLPPTPPANEGNGVMGASFGRGGSMSTSTTFSLEDTTFERNLKSMAFPYKFERESSDFGGGVGTESVVSGVSGATFGGVMNSTTVANGSVGAAPVVPLPTPGSEVDERKYQDAKSEESSTKIMATTKTRDLSRVIEILVTSEQTYIGRLETCVDALEEVVKTWESENSYETDHDIEIMNASMREDTTPENTTGDRAEILREFGTYSPNPYTPLLSIHTLLLESHQSFLDAIRQLQSTGKASVGKEARGLAQQLKQHILRILNPVVRYIVIRTREPDTLSDIYNADSNDSGTRLCLRNEMDRVVNIYEGVADHIDDGQIIRELCKRVRGVVGVTVDTA